MKTAKAFLLSLALLMLNNVSAQPPGGYTPLPDDSLDIGGQEIVPVWPGVVNDSIGESDPIIPVGPGIGNPKAPTRPLYVSLSSHALFTYGQFDGYTLYIINDDNTIVYTTEVWADETTIALPSCLSGTFTIAFVAPDNSCYYAEIEL